MIRINISHWRLKDLLKEKPEFYTQLRATEQGKDLPIVEEFDKGYTSFTGVVNSPIDVPVDMYKYIEWEPIPALKIIRDNGESCRGATIAEAMVAHQVHLPGNELLKLNKVKVVEDYCTDALQDELNDGWRMVAVIPRAGQRRPDYVLGVYELK